MEDDQLHPGAALNSKNRWWLAYLVKAALVAVAIWLFFRHPADMLVSYASIAVFFIAIPKMRARGRANRQAKAAGTLPFDFQPGVRDILATELVRNPLIEAGVWAGVALAIGSLFYCVYSIHLQIPKT